LADPYLPKTHHLDRRAAAIAAVGATLGADDDLIDTRALAAWLGLSRQWCEIGRSKGYGPPFVKIAPSRVRYRRGDVLKWLESRTYRAVGEYR
jgi:predicted DNA-binding transcriptional regulator AlpA